VFERDSDEVYLFRSADDASKYLEPIDVDREEFEVFDATGRPMKVEVANEDGREIVRLAGIPAAPARWVEVRERLRSYFRRLRQWNDDYDAMERSALLGLLTERFARI